MYPRKYGASLIFLCGAVAIGECDLRVVCVELVVIEFGLVDMNVLIATVALVIILRQCNIIFASSIILLCMLGGTDDAESDREMPAARAHFHRRHYISVECDGDSRRCGDRMFSRINFSGKE